MCSTFLLNVAAGFPTFWDLIILDDMDVQIRLINDR